MANNSISPMVPHFISTAFKDNNVVSINLVDLYSLAEEYYGTLDYSRLYYVNEMLKGLIDDDIIIQKGNTIYKPEKIAV